VAQFGADRAATVRERLHSVGEPYVWPAGVRQLRGNWWVYTSWCRKAKMETRP